MTYVRIPLTTSANQTLNCKITVGSQNISLRLFLRYLDEYSYWVMDIINPSTGSAILTALPLVPGNYPAANILGDYEYLGLGKAYLLKASDTSQEYPDNNTLGSIWVLAWGDDS